MSSLSGFLSRESLSLNMLSSRYPNRCNTQFKSSTDLNLYFQKQQLFSANNRNTCYGLKLEIFIWNLWIWGYSGKCPREKKKKKPAKASANSCITSSFYLGCWPSHTRCVCCGELSKAGRLGNRNPRTEPAPLVVSYNTLCPAGVL